MKIGIDIDDTITDTRSLQIKYWKDYIKSYPNENYTENLPDSINGFSDSYVQIFWDIYREQLFDAPIKNNVDLITNKLKENGHTLCIITSRSDNKYKDLKKRIREFMEFNNIHIDIIYTGIRNKGKFCYENNFDLFIDDSIDHVKAAKEYGINAILFNKNTNYEGLQTDNWLDLYEIIKKMNL